MDAEVREALQNKHLSAEPVDPRALIAGCLAPCDPIIFDGITGDEIRKAALHTQGAAGPSGGDSEQWRRMCTSFGESSTDLCHAMALVAR